MAFSIGVLTITPRSSFAQKFSPEDTINIYTMKGTYYANRFEGRKTSSGEVFSQSKFTAAHKRIKFGTLVRVTNPKNGASVIVKINDRCARNGVIDLSKIAARSIGISNHTVEVQILPDSYTQEWQQQKGPEISKDTTARPNKKNNDHKKNHTNKNKHTDKTNTSTKSTKSSIEASETSKESISTHNDLPIPEY